MKDIGNTQNGDCHPGLRGIIRDFPACPGVYIMNDRRGKALYIGKAGNLRNRVTSYLNKNSDTRILIPDLMKKVRDIQYLVTATNSEALILENNLIKKHKPPYNIRLKDDKTYLSLKVTVSEEWPRVVSTRRCVEDGAIYFGPYASAATARELIRLIKQVFTLRTCADGFFRTRKRPCIQHEIGRCSAPCVKRVSAEQYRSQVRGVINFLRGRSGPLMRQLERAMARAAEAHQYERAALLRDRLEAIRKARERQAAHEVNLQDLDVFGLFKEGQYFTIQALFIRGGRVLDAAPFHLRSALPDAEVMRSFLTQFYLAGRDIPSELVLPIFPADRPSLEAIFREKKGKKVRLSLGKRGQRRALASLATQNAVEAARGRLVSEKKRTAALGEMAAALSLPGPPERIECYDISTTGGTHAVGAMTVMHKGAPDRSAYRQFRIRTVRGMDDFAMLREVIRRRLTMTDRPPLPDLLLVDGGPAQVSQAVAIIKEVQEAAIDVSGIAVAGIAKSRIKADRRTTERIFLPGSSEPAALEDDAPASRLLQALRDEAHRFAIQYHRKLRRKHALTSGLESVKGLGPARIRRLFEEFGGLAALRRLSVDDLHTRGKLPKAVAEALRAFLHPPPKDGAP